MTVALSYLDPILDELSAGNTAMADAFGKYVHCGFWDDPASATGTTEDYLDAARRMNSELLGDAIRATGASCCLDVGCGFGGTLSDLNEACRQLHLTGVNIDHRQIRRAQREVQTRARKGNRISLLTADGCALPFRDECFDLVLSIEAISHFHSRRSFFVEARRVLKPQGRLVLSDFLSSPWTLPAKILLFLRHARIVKQLWGAAGVPVTRTGYGRLATHAGFRVDRIRDITANMLPTFDFLNRFAAQFSGRNRERFMHASRFIEVSATRGYSRYSILSFTRM
jgi:ubiquinone/menaquinone biosynthesis C-methylase UbiE